MVDCCIDLNHIEATCGNNAAGLKRILGIACGSHVTTIPAADGHKITTPVTLRAAVAASGSTPAVTAGEIFEWHFAREDQSYTSKRNKDTGEWETELKIFIPKMEAEKSDILNNATGDDKIVFFTDRNGKKRIVGDKEDGCTVNVEEQATPKNGYVVTITHSGGHSPYFYEV
jgi:hypothetical protein